MFIKVANSEGKNIINPEELSKIKMEFLDVVDENDNAVGKASMDEIYAERLPHRIVHILIFNDKGKLALQMRSKYKSFCPQHWSTPVGGHVQSGESYEEAAMREFEEELGTKVPITQIRKDFYTDVKGNKKFLATFKAVFNGPFNLNSEEVERIEFFGLDEIKKMIAKGEKFHPELLFLLKKQLDIV